MSENTNAAALTSLRTRNIVGRMTIGIDLGDRRSHFCVLNEQAQVIARGFLPTTSQLFVVNLKVCHRVSLRSKRALILCGPTKYSKCVDMKSSSVILARS